MANDANGIIDLPDCIDLVLNKKMLELSDGWDTIYGALLTNGLQLVLLLVIFGCLNKSRHVASILAPLREADARSQRCSSWFFEALFVEVDKVLTIDGQVLVRFCQLGLKFSILGALVGGCLLPIYSGGKAKASGFFKYSISNFTVQESNQFWFVVSAAYLLTGYFMFLMRGEWRHYATMKRQHFVRRAEGKLGASAAQAQYSVMLERVPIEGRNVDTLRDRFEELFGVTGVHSCSVSMETVQLYRLRHLKWTTQFANRGACCSCSCCNHTQSGLRASLKKILVLERAVAHWLYLAVDGLKFDQPFVVTLTSSRSATSSTAFVTLSSPSARLIAEQLVLFDRNSDSNWVVSPAPESRDIVWPNVSYSLTQVNTQSRLGSLLCFVGLLFWSIPVTGIQVYASSQDHLDRGVIQFLERFGIKVLVLNYVPVLALMALLGMLPRCLSWLSVNFELMKVKSKIMRKVLARNLRFQLATLYVNVFTGLLYDSFKDIMLQPVCATVILGKAMPRVAIYFTSFVIARIGTTLPLLLLQPWNYFSLDVYAVLRHRKAAGPIYCQFGTEAPTVTIVLVLALMYCLVTPLIMPLCVLYFALASVVYRWLFLNVYSVEFDCGGEFWYDLFHGAMLGLILSLLSLSGIAALYTHPRSYEVLAMLLLLLVTLWGYFRLVSTFSALSEAMTYQEAVRCRGMSEKVVKEFVDDYYLDPLVKKIQAKINIANRNEGLGGRSSSSEVEYARLIQAVLDEDLGVFALEHESPIAADSVCAAEAQQLLGSSGAGTDSDEEASQSECFDPGTPEEPALCCSFP